MNGIHLRWPAAAAAAGLLLAAGAGAAYLFLPRPGENSAARPARAAAPSAHSEAPPTPGRPDHPRGQTENAPATDARVAIPDDVARRAGLVLTTVTTGAGPGARRVPAVVEPNAYHQVAVTSLLGGRITEVLAELGAHVRKGQTLARIFSPGLADAESQYIAARAELQAHERELLRTGQLVQIGAASRQELERTEAEHAVRKAGLETARSRLRLLGLDAAAIDALTPGAPTASSVEVRAPLAGAITERAANPGLNVDAGAKLFTIVDLSTVWVVGDLYEQDLANVRVGQPVGVAIASIGAASIAGRVAYIDPQINLQTRTARVRVEIPNPGGAALLGAFAELRLEGATAGAGTLVPRTAIQRVGDQAVVYVAVPGKAGLFAERRVRLGRVSGTTVEVLDGIQPGDTVVSEGSFFVRAERERTRPQGIIETP